MGRVQEMETVELNRLRELIKTLNKEKGIRLDNFTSKEISYQYLYLFLSGQRNLSKEKFEILVLNVNKFLESLK